MLKYLRHIFDYLPCIFNYLREVFYHVKKIFFFGRNRFEQKPYSAYFLVGRLFLVSYLC